MSKQQDNHLIEIKDLFVNYNLPKGCLHAVRGVNLTIDAGDVVGIVGESGCGKSVMSRAVLGILPTPPAEVVGGQILYKGQDLLKMKARQLRKIRGNRISMIFQEPMSSLNPVYTIGNQMLEAVTLHQDVSGAEAKAIAVDMLKKVGLPDPEQRMNYYPFQLSGGMRQRVMIAMALCCKPDLLIADEPTTALDVTIQAQIMELLQSLHAETGMTLMMITHNLALVKNIATKVVVMYAGTVVEHATTEQLFNDPRHPYTLGLLSCIPRLQGDMEELSTIEGSLPSAFNPPHGCPFYDRCEQRKDICKTEKPQLVTLSDDHRVACHLFS